MRLNTYILRKALKEMGFTFSGYGDIESATNICTTSHKTYSCVSDFLLDTKDPDPYISWFIYKEDCGKDIAKLLELCKDEMYEIAKVPADRLNK